MSNRRNESVSDVDYEATIRHYQDLNDQIELKTHEVFESVIKLSNQTDKSVKSDDIASEVIDTRSSLNDHSSQPNHANKNQLIVDMNKKLLAMQNELQGISLKNKQLEQEKEKQKQELLHSKESLKKIKTVLSARQIAQDVQKKEMDRVHEKLKSEEQSQKDLHKEVERLSKQLVLAAREKSKLEEKLECCKSDVVLLKQNKESDCSRNQASIMIKCIKRQAVLIENLLSQISILERENTQPAQS